MSHTHATPSRVAIVAISELTTRPLEAGWFDIAEGAALRAAEDRQSLRCIDVVEPAFDLVVTLVARGTLSTDGTATLKPVSSEKLATLLKALSSEPPRLSAAPKAGPVQKSTNTEAEQSRGLWSALSINMTVLAPESTAKNASDGWWEAIITAIQGDTVTLRWRDYPEEGIIKRKRHQLAMLHPTQVG